jgi:cytidylate kinase
MTSSDPAGVPVIAIDGPGGSGKGTVAMRLAQELDWHFLDSGALYRIVAVAAMDRAIAPEDEHALGELVLQLDVNFGFSGEGMLILLDGNLIVGRLRSEKVSAFASKVATVPAVRAALVERQRAFRKPPGLVADGKQLKEKGESVNLSRLFRDIEKRDERDSSRSISPLKPAADAQIIDSTDMSIDKVLGTIHKLLENT